MAQESGSYSVDLNISPTGKINKVQLENETGDFIGTMNYRKLASGQTELGFDFSPIESSELKVEFKNFGRTIYQDEVFNGPAFLNESIEGEEHILSSETHVLKDSEEWFWGVLLVAYCCLELEVTMNDDGNNSVTIGFDCDCFEIDLSATNAEGTTYSDIDEIVVTAM